MKPFIGLLSLFSLVLIGAILALLAIRNDIRSSYRPVLGLSVDANRKELGDAIPGSHFVADPRDVWQTPDIEEITIPEVPDADAIWGSLGLDNLGRVWFGVSTDATATASAHLFCYDPDNGWVSNRGDVLTQINIADKRRPHETQMKIHSRIIQAADGYLYFASMDERGERVDGTRLPDWGSHLWRLKPSEDRWEYLATVREGLIAVAGGGRYIYALGYFGHILYQYDTATGLLRNTPVGAAGGHISRNFLCDVNGHAYVPRVTMRDANTITRGTDRFRVELVELDENLTAIGVTPLEHYGATSDDRSHGITGFVQLADGSIVFATHLGRLYHVVPQRGEAATVNNLGWFHPDGTAYTASLFTFSGKRYIAGLGKGRRNFFDWIVYDLEERVSRAVPLDFQELSKEADRGIQLYGSNIQDAQGNFYVAGGIGRHPQRPLLLRVLYDRTKEPAIQPSVAAKVSAPARAANEVSDDAAGKNKRLEDLIFKGTGHDWRAATEEERLACSQMIADWMHPLDSETDRLMWAKSYFERLDQLAGQPDGFSGLIAEWIPPIHGILINEKTKAPMVAPQSPADARP